MTRFVHGNGDRPHSPMHEAVIFSGHPNASRREKDFAMSVKFTGLKAMTIGAALSMTAGLAFAADDTVSTSTIINSLKPTKMVTRRLSLDPRQLEQKNREVILI